MKQHTRQYTYRPARRGQTLIVAIAVLFVLLFIGGVFVAQVARNLQEAGRSREVGDAYDLANAGVTYCKEMLVSGEDGADWRPAPTAPFPSPNDPTGLRDPDWFWLSQGFARLSQRGGRALVRVIYDPHPEDPRSQMLRIEAIGRPGELDPLDPTVFVQRGSAPRLRRELIGYLQIGLTDNLRTVTDKNRNAGVAEIGVQNIGVPLATILGDPTLATAPSGINNSNLLFGGGIRSNTDLRLVGPVYVYTSPRGVNPEVGVEGIQVAGKLLLEATRDINNDGVINQNDREQYIGQGINQAPNLANRLTASEDPAFNTHDGRVRDDSTQGDVSGRVRAVRYVQFPDLEQTLSATGVNRYRWITRFSGVWGNRNNRRFNTGENGFGRGIYLNNLEDKQEEAGDPTVPGSYSLRADWTNPSSLFSQSAWQGPFYRPPGIIIELLGDRIRFTRTDNRTFNNPDGTPITQQGGKVFEVGLSDFERQNYRLPDGTTFRLERLNHDGDEPDPSNTLNKPFGDRYSYGVNVVIMAEGNVRVRGVYGAITNPSDTTESANIPSKVGRVHLTIVSGGTAYIEGNIVKGDGYMSGGQAVLERASTCAILAKDYICVNTTMFTSPQNQTQAWSQVVPGDDLSGFYTEVGQARSTFDMSFSYGIDPLEYQGNNGSPSFLFLRHAALTPGPSLINLLINPAFVLPNDPKSPFYRFGTLGIGGVEEAYMLGLKLNVNGNFFLSDPSSITPNFEMRSFPLFPQPQANNYALNQLPGYENLLRFQMDNTTQEQLQQGFGTSLGSGGLSPYFLGTALVAPLDIRIEAVLYAQERSFFVIPGYPANPSSDDSRQAVTDRGGFRRSFNENNIDLNEREFKRMYPFYNEPTDVRITVYGAVAENYPASLADQTAWLSKWGYIPERFGNSNQFVPDLHRRVHDPVSINPGEDRSQDFRTPAEQTAYGANEGITRGLRFVYDPALALPYFAPTRTDLVNSSRQLREQRALRYRLHRATASLPQNIVQILPPTPRLPVCPDLLFFGEADRPLGQ